jgi:hypothetical protein
LFSSRSRATRALPLFDGGDKVPLPHAPGPGDADFLGDPLQIGNEQLGKIITARRPAARP